jgi:hypothetical protein
MSYFNWSSAQRFANPERPVEYVAMTLPEAISVNCECGAHHEPGHMVIAAVEGLRLKPEGLMVDPSGWGLACYHDAPEDIDPARERNILAGLAGFAVEKRYREQNNYPPRDTLDVAHNRDNVVTRTLLGKLNGDYWVNDFRLTEQLKGLIDRHWLAIDALASALLRQNWETIKPLKSGGQWSHPNETMAKYLSGEEAARILAEHEIEAVVSN